MGKARNTILRQLPAGMPDWSLLSAHMRDAIQDLPRLTGIVADFLLLARKEYTTAREFEEVIDREQGLRDWLLRQSNSGFFNLSRPVHSLADATVVIGLDQLKRMVYAQCSGALFRRRMRCYHYPRDGFWLHALAVASCCRLLTVTAREARDESSPLPELPTAEEAFVAGLLHDLGKALLDDLLDPRGGQRPISRAEESAASGVDHAQLSALIAEHWNLPPVVVAAIGAHHEVPAGAAAPPGAVLVHLADLICNDWGLGKWTYPRMQHEPRLQDRELPLGDTGLSTSLIEARYPPLRGILAGLDEMMRLCRSNPVGPATPYRKPAASAAEDRRTQPERGRSDRGRNSRRSRSRRSSRRRRR